MRTLLLAALLGLALLPGAGHAETLYFIHVDHLNTPRLAVGDDLVERWRWDQAEPFGNNPPIETMGLEGYPINLPLRYPGQYADKETNRHYNYFRDYGPAEGRYIQSDPIGLSGGINLYAYVKGNPISRTDPYGLWPFGAPGRSQAERIAPGELRRLVPELTKQEAEQLSKDAIQESGWGDVTGFPSPIPSQPPKTWSDLTDPQKEFIRDFLDRLPERNKDAIEKVKKYCVPAQR